MVGLYPNKTEFLFVFPVRNRGSICNVKTLFLLLMCLNALTSKHLDFYRKEKKIKYFFSERRD